MTHPWHDLPPFPDPGQPDVFHVVIEIPNRTHQAELRGYKR